MIKTEKDFTPEQLEVLDEIGLKPHVAAFLCDDEDWQNFVEGLIEMSPEDRNAIWYGSNAVFDKYDVE